MHTELPISTVIKSQLNLTRKSDIAEKKPIVRTTLSGIALQCGDDDHSRSENFGDSVIRNMVIIYSPYGTNAYGSRSEEFVGG